LVELLGRGEMAQVWPARNTDTDRIVAIKLLPGHLFDDEEFQWRFRQEAHAAPRSNNPHVPIDSYVESTATSTSVCGLPRAAICKLRWPARQGVSPRQQHGGGFFLVYSPCQH
jgi:serine/threonine protein kinase